MEATNQKAIRLPDEWIIPAESSDLANWQKTWMNEQAWEEMEFDFDLDFSLWGITKSLFSLFIFWK